MTNLKVNSASMCIAESHKQDSVYYSRGLMTLSLVLAEKCFKEQHRCT